jgi:hypothetical protein
MMRRQRQVVARLDTIGEEFLAYVGKQADLADELTRLCRGLDGGRLLAGYLRHVREASARQEAAPVTLSVWLDVVEDLENLPRGSLWAKMSWRNAR